MAGSLTPTLLVLIGLPGAGKSLLAASVACRRGWVRLDRDDLQRRRPKAAATSRLWKLAELELRRGRSVALDGMTFARESQRSQARALARRSGARCVEVWLQCPVALAQLRVRRGRRHPARDRNAARVRRVAGQFDPVAPGVLRLDVRWTAATLRRRLRRLLAA